MTGNSNQTDEVSRLISETDQWLTRVKTWQQEADPVKSASEETEKVPALTAYLTRLQSQLKAFVSVPEALHALPQVGLLLGRLTTIPRLLLEQSLFRALLGCILCLHVENPTSPIENRSIAWVLNQLQNMVCQTNRKVVGGKESLVTSITGHSTGELHAACSAILSDEITRCVSEQRLLGASISTIRTLCSVCMVCLSLCHIEIYGKLLYTTLSALLSETKPSPEVQQIHQKLVCSQKYPYTGVDHVTCLPYDVQILVWNTSKASLEHEVLDLVNQVTQGSLRSVAHKILGRHLVKACARVAPVYHAVFDMMRALICQTRGHWKVILLTHWLHQHVRQIIQKQPQSSLSISGQYPSRLWPLANLLAVSPKGLPAASVSHHLNVLGQSLQTECEGPCSPDDVRFICIQHLEWYSMALCHVLCCDKEVVPSCITVLRVLHSHGVNMDVLDIIDSLRGLFNKVSLTIMDLHCALTPVMSQGPSQGQRVPTSVLVTQLLLVFGVLSKGGSSIIQTISDLTCPHGSPDVRAEAWINTLDTIQYYTDITSEKLTLYIRQNLQMGTKM